MEPETEGLQWAPEESTRAGMGAGEARREKYRRRPGGLEGGGGATIGAESGGPSAGQAQARNSR